MHSTLILDAFENDCRQSHVPDMRGIIFPKSNTFYYEWYKIIENQNTRTRMDCVNPEIV